MKKWLCMLVMILMLSSALAQTVQDDALAFMQSAGIEADSVMRIDNEIIVTLMNGGTATLHMEGDFDKYHLAWVFDEAADADVALYLDDALTLLAALEAKIPADAAELSVSEMIRVRSWTATLEKALDSMTALGEQGLLILQEQLETQEDCELNGLRERLMVRIRQKMTENENSPTGYDGSESFFCSFSSGAKKSS